MNAFDDAFEITWHGNTVVIAPSASIETMRWDLIEQAADVLMKPLSREEAPFIVFDLSDVRYFGSVFLQLLLRCHTKVKPKGGELVLCGVSEMARELLSVTALDTLWAIYDTREQALEALAT
jgi:anti-sigma B factor antagonist